MEQQQNPKKPINKAKQNRNQATYTHFYSIPLVSEEQQKMFHNLQQEFLGELDENHKKSLRPNDEKLFHITLGMLALPNENIKQKVEKLFQAQKQKVLDLLQNKNQIDIKLGKIGSFQDKFKNDIIIYLEVIPDQILIKINDLLIRPLVQEEIIDTESKDFAQAHLKYDHKLNAFMSQQYHLTLFRISKDNVPGVKLDFKQVIDKFQEKQEMGITLGKTIDISTRFEFAENNYYKPFSQIDLNQQQ